MSSNHKVYAWIPKNIKKLRKRRGWTQADLGGRARTTMVPMIEAGIRTPSVSTLASLAGALGVPVATLVREPRKRGAANNGK